MRPIIIPLLALALLAAAALALTPPTAAQQPVSWQRGLTADAAYQYADVEAINLFNGNLTLTVPLGISYPIGPSFSLQLMASYNANGWVVEQAQCPGQPYAYPEPSPYANAGFGWQVHLGKLVPPEDQPNVPFGDSWTYLSPDGGEHRFFDRLHPGHPANPPSHVTYTQDGTYMRLREIPGSNCRGVVGTDSSVCWTLDMPDGVKKEFRDFDPGPGNLDVRLVRIRDPFGNWLHVDYETTGGDRWRLRDSHGREHTIDFVGGPSGSFTRVKNVHLEAFGGGTATYVFGYDQRDVPRMHMEEDTLPDCATVEESIPVFLLDLIRQPDLSAWQMAYEPAVDWTGDAQPRPVLSAGIASLRLPTDGRIDWTYVQHAIPAFDDDGQAPPNFNEAYGVATKDLYTSSAGSAIGTWTYDYFGFQDQDPSDPTAPCHKKVTVTDPLDHATVHYFSLARAAQRWSFGLPYSRCKPRPALDGETTYVSQEIYDGADEPENLLRTVEVAYTGDGWNQLLAQSKNVRLIRRRTVFHDDGDRRRETSLSNFDGLGHHRTVVTGGTLSPGTGDERTTVTTYNPGAGFYDYDPDTQSGGNGFTLPSAGAPWYVEHVTERRTSEAGQTEKVQLCMDENTGFVYRRRRLAQANPQPQDLLTVLQPTGGGFVDREEHYGGEVQSLTTSYSDLCTMPLPGSAQYRTDHDYQTGVRARSVAYDSSCGLPLLELADRTIDPGTGLVASSRDPADVQTDFDFDAMGRLVYEKTDESASLHVVHDLPPEDGHAPPVFTTKVCSGTASCSAGQSLAWSQIQLDGLGRKTVERVRVAGVTGSEEHQRAFTYNARGWLLGQGVWNGPQATVYAGHDRFGRPGSITQPGENPVELTYEGERTVTRKSTVTGAGNAWVTEVRDDHGRLVGVCDGASSAWNGACTSGVWTSYRYDVGNRLDTVCVNGDVANCTGQLRRFDYDQRGLLTGERHPELGSGNGAWTFYEYDAAGNAVEKDAPGTAFDLDYTYDAAGRLIRVDEASTGRPLEEYFYGVQNGPGGDRRAGKLVEQRRHNYRNLASPLAEGTFDVLVSERFRYEGKSGRISKRQTRWHNAPTTYAFETGFTWDPQGNLTSLTYPRCLHDDRREDCAGLDPARTVGFQYQHGFLTEVDGYASRIDYQRGGLLHRVAGTNGVTWRMTPDPSGLARPGRIQTDETAWSTGDYEYDGTGNVQSIGSLGFSYDRFSRLTAGDTLGPTGQIATQSASYDPYGNLTSLNTNGELLSLPASPSSNRLTGLGASYDLQGNLTALGIDGESFQYTWDAGGRMASMASNQDQARVFVYTADGERLMSFDCAGGTCSEDSPPRETWTLRDLDGKVLRVYGHLWGSDWTWDRDYVHRDGLPLATITPAGTRWLHLDHLGSTRLITDENGDETAEMAYYPYGAQAYESGVSDVELRFTGHERDDAAGVENDVLDYMHARYCSPVLGRFLRVDPAMQTERALGAPQLWNRYSYALGNPIAYNDPSGRVVNLASLSSEEREQLMDDLAAATGLMLSFDEDSGTLAVVGVVESVSGEQVGSPTARNDLLNAITSDKTIYGVPRNDSNAVNMGVTSGPLIFLDFADMSKIDTGENPAATFNTGMIFLHEYIHTKGKSDPPFEMTQKVPTARGDVVEHINKIREELGLPLRLQFLTIKDSRGHHIPFSNGPVYVPYGIGKEDNR